MEKFIKAIQETISYSWMVFVETWKSIEKWTGIMKVILSLLMLTIMLSCLVFASIMAGFPNWLETLISDVTSNFRFDATKLAFYALIASLVFPFLFLHEAAKIHSRQKDEMSKYNWDKVEFEEVPYSIVGKSGYALRLVNNKIFDITKIQILLTEIRIDEKAKPKPNKAWYFQSIDYDDDVLTYLDDNGMKSETIKDYAITEIVKNRKSFTCKLITSSDIEDDYTKLPYRGLKRDSDLEVVVEITLRATIKIDGEQITLPQKYMKIFILQDGSIKIRRKDNIQK